VEQSFRGVASLSAMPQYIPLALLRSVRLRGPRAAGSTVHTVRAARRARQYTMYHTIYNVSHNRARSNAAGLGARSVSDLHLARVSTADREAGSGSTTCGPSRPDTTARGTCVARAWPVWRAQRSGVCARTPGDKSDESPLGPDTRPGQTGCAATKTLAARRVTTQSRHTTSRDITPRTVRQWGRGEPCRP
jgi:hypothetical protein